MSTNRAGTQQRALATRDKPGLLENTAHLWTMRDSNCVDARSAPAAAQSHASWMLARIALSECFAVGHHDWKFARDGRGKPFIVAPQEYRGLGVSISHTDGLVACLL